MNVLSLFDGISCGQLALHRAGIPYDRYFASEIDTQAIKITQKNYPETIQVGDVSDVAVSDLLDIDLLIGGSPCQSFSVAGRGEGFSGKSRLFWEYVRILNEANPRYFLFENVMMKEEWSGTITEELGVPPAIINSKFFTPQNRPRLYWTNISLNPLPAYKRRKISDILENEVDEKYYLTKRQLSKLDLNFKWNGDEIIRHRGGSHQQDDIFRHDGLMGCLAASHHGAARHLTKTCLPNGRIRRLTEKECERLQGVPDGYTEGISSSKRYEILGNGWTVDVISFIFGGIGCKPRLRSTIRQGSFL